MTRTGESNTSINLKVDLKDQFLVMKSCLRLL